MYNLTNKQTMEHSSSLFSGLVYNLLSQKLLISLYITRSK